MGITERPEVAAVWHHVSQWRYLVCGIGDPAQRAGAIRHQNREIPELDNPGGGGVVSNMKATPDGNLAIAESGVNKVGLVVVGNSVPSARQ